MFLRQDGDVTLYRLQFKRNGSADTWSYCTEYLFGCPHEDYQSCCLFANSKEVHGTTKREVAMLVLKKFREQYSDNEFRVEAVVMSQYRELIY